MEEDKKQHGGKRSGAGRKSAYGPGVETAQYMLPKECAQECQAFARMTLANGGMAPMRCVGDHAECDIRVPRGEAKDLAAIVARVRQFESRIDMMVQRIDEDHEYVVLSYTNVSDLVGILQEFYLMQGEKNVKRKKKKD